MDGLSPERLFRTLEERRFHGYLDFGEAFVLYRTMLHRRNVPTAPVVAVYPKRRSVLPIPILSDNSLIRDAPRHKGGTFHRDTPRALRRVRR